MALLRPKELRAMRPEDVKAKLRELNDELMHERGVAAMGGAPASPGKIRALRTNIARIHTIQRELEIAEIKKKAAEKAPQKTPAKGMKEKKKVEREERKQEEKK